jgi:integrase/recombinase XerD
MAPSPWDITRDMFLSGDEVDELLSHVRTRAMQAASAERNHARVDQLMIEMLLFTGLRCSEFCGLRLGEAVLEAEGACITVRGRRGGGRTAWVPPHVARLIQDYVRQIRPSLLPPDIDPADPAGPLIVSERGQPYERSGLYRRVVRILSQAGLGARASVQLLRHTYAYLAYLRTGGNLLFVQRQLGHAHPMITAIYAKFVDESYADLAQRVAAPNRPLRARRHSASPSPSQRRTK